MKNLVLTAALGAVATREVAETNVITGHDEVEIYPTFVAGAIEKAERHDRGRSNAASIKRQAAKKRNVRKRSRK